MTQSKKTYILFSVVNRRLRWVAPEGRGNPQMPTRYGSLAEQSRKVPRGQRGEVIPTFPRPQTLQHILKMKKKSKLQKVEQETVPTKYRIYPNLKQRKYLERCFRVSRIVWNWLLGIQKDYDKSVTNYIKEKHEKHLEKFSKKLDLEKKSDTKKLSLEIIRLKKEEAIPPRITRAFIKNIIPSIAKEEIEKLVVNKKDNKAGNKTLNILDLKRQISAILRSEKPILNTVSSQGIFHIPLNLAKAWKMCYDKNFPDFGEPKFKNRFAKQSFTFDTAKLDLETGKLFLPPKNKNIYIKTKVHRIVEGEQKRVTIHKTKSGDYYASVNFRQESYFPAPKSQVNKSDTVGIDLGIKDDYVIMSGGHGAIKNPKFFKKHQRKIAMLNRKLSRSKKGSGSRKKTIQALNKEYEKLSRCREDFQHKVSHSIVSDESVNAVAVEDLDVKGMVSKNKPKESKNGNFLPNGQSAKRGMNKATLDAGFGRLRGMLEYKCKRHGKNFGKVGRFFASSKTCNNCGHLNKELKVSEQYWVCSECGVKHERNFNAADNVRDEFLRTYKPLKK